MEINSNLFINLTMIYLFIFLCDQMKVNRLPISLLKINIIMFKRVMFQGIVVYFAFFVVKMLIT